MRNTSKSEALENVIEEQAMRTPRIVLHLVAGTDEVPPRWIIVQADDESGAGVIVATFGELEGPAARAYAARVAAGRGLPLDDSMAANAGD